MAIEDLTTPLDRPDAQPTPAAAPAGESMLIERLMPHFDAVRVEHRIVPGDIATVYAATRRADFIRAWRGSAAVRVLFAVRGMAERAVSLIARREYREPPPPESMRLADMPTRGDWVLLGEDPPNEIAFGVIGRFWAGETVWAEIDATDFEAFTVARGPAGIKQSSHRPRWFPAFDTARDLARAGAQTPNARPAGRSRLRPLPRRWIRSLAHGTRALEV